MNSLDRLPLGSAGIIQAILGSDALSQRLMELGLLEGEVIKVVRFAPLGDPIEVQVGTSLLSLRLAEAARVQVAEQTGEGGSTT